MTEQEIKSAIAVYLAATIVAFCIYLCGYLYEGIANKDWSIKFKDNLTKACGGFLFLTLFVFGAIVILSAIIQVIL